MDVFTLTYYIKLRSAYLLSYAAVLIGHKLVLTVRLCVC